MSWIKTCLEWLEGQGVNRRWCKNFLYFFAPLIAMGLLSAWNIGSPLKRAAVIMALAVLKQLVWDVIWHHYKFDCIDLVPTVIALGFGCLFTGFWW